jgi:hypothetical protein
MTEIELTKTLTGGRYRLETEHGDELRPRQLPASGGRYRLETEHGDAELVYALRNGAVVIERTFAPDEVRGRGIALRLVERAVADARAAGAAVIPACSYAAAVFDRRPDWGEIRRGGGFCARRR